MRSFKPVVFATLMAGSLIPSAGLTADRDLLDDLKDRFERGREQIERERSDRERDGDRYERERDRDDRDVRDRRDRYDRENRVVSGTVKDVDRKGRTFLVEQKNNDSFTVLVPSDIDSRDKERFSKLRKGDNVRLAGRFERENRFKLEEFR
jgi:hypothetical protein